MESLIHKPNVYVFHRTRKRGKLLLQLKSWCPGKIPLEMTARLELKRHGVRYMNYLRQRESTDFRGMSLNKGLSLRGVMVS